MTQDLTTQPKSLPKLAGQPVDVEALLQRYLDGETGPEIAKSYGVTKQALSLFMYQHGEEQWKKAQFAKAHDRAEQAEGYLDEIKQRIRTADKEERERLQLDLAHAREQLKSAQWTLEKVARRIYGDDKAALAILGNGVTVQLVSFTSDSASRPERLVEGSTVTD